LLATIATSLHSVQAHAGTGSVGANGTYQTGFDIPVPAAPAAPQISLNYYSGANASLAGVGWDLSIGWPTSILRDVRFGTPQWKLDSAWLWGSTPLIQRDVSQVPARDPFRCAQGNEREYRLAPDALACISINLDSGKEKSKVYLATGTILEYEPIIYDGRIYPAAPAGAETPVFAFRLSSVTDRNGYRTCFRYNEFGDTLRGQVAVLAEIAYGPGPVANNCASILASASRHHIDFAYQDLAASGFFATWTLRFGAPAAFKSLLSRITTFAAGEQQNEFDLVYDGMMTESRRPRLVRIDQSVRDSSGAMKTRAVRAFVYGDRQLKFGDPLGKPEVLDVGALNTFPPSLSGTVSRPMRRPSLFDNPLGAGQIGQDVATDVAPLTNATTEQWGFVDINGDGLPDFQWGIEKGLDRSWSTYETGITTSIGPRPAQQQVLINEGVSNSKLATTRVPIDSHANEAAPDSLEQGYTQGVRDPFASPVDPQIDGFSPWFWGEGNGMTRTGMPVSVSGAEIVNAAPDCPPDESQDTRQWPRYPDGIYPGAKGSSGGTQFLSGLTNLRLLQPGENLNLGNPVLSIVQGIHDGYRSTYSMSSAVSGWVDLNGDGVPEFVATAGSIERFSIAPACRLSISGLLTPGHYGARETFPAAKDTRNSSGGRTSTTETDWFVGSPLLSDDFPTVALPLKLERKPGPKGPSGLPLSYDVSTASSEGFGITLPIGSAITAGISSIWSGWQGIASAAPGLTVDTFSPRSSTGSAFSVSTPSTTALMQGLGSIARSGASGASIADFILSIVKVNYDLTVVSARSENRSETRAQLLDINGDGLPDYVLYNGGEHTDPTDPLTGIHRGSLVAFFNSPTGFSGPTVINAGFAYPSAPPDADAIEQKLAGLTGLRVLANLLTNTLTGVPPDKKCYVGGVACADYVASLTSIIDTTNGILSDPILQPFIDSTRDAVPQERSQLNEIEQLLAAITAERDLLLAGVFVPPGLIPANFPVEIDTITWAAKMMVKDLDYLVRTIRQIGHSSRINVVSEGFSQMDASDISGAVLPQESRGVSVQTRGFVDLNGDGLPDYVVTDDRTSLCPKGQWEVFWGTGTSSITAGRAFLAQPECIVVPPSPQSLVDRGFATLPLQVDAVYKAPADPTKGQKVDMLVHSYVSLNDFNRDGRPDIVIAGDGDEPWDPVEFPVAGASNVRTWHVFLNNGFGFETASSLNVPSPTNTLAGLEPASTAAAGMDVLFPVMRTTHTFANPVGSRDTSETHAAMIDIDGDGTPEIVRRVHIKDSDPTKPMREGLLVWRRQDTGPQDLMIEDRYTIEGRRNLVEYKPSASFQWTDATPDGKAPRYGHYASAGIPVQLVSSVTTEPLLGRAEQRTRQGYDYKFPYFDPATRTPAGFALKATAPLDPVTGQFIPASVTELQRSAQRPNLVPGITHSRSRVRGVQGIGAPVREVLTSFVEETTATGGVGGLTSVFSAPTRTFVVEYPANLSQGAIFDVGFDGREPYRERVGGGYPLTAPSGILDPVAATGGAVLFDLTEQTGITYPSPHAVSAPGTPQISEVTVEAWLRPTVLEDGRTVVEQSGGYRLVVRKIGTEFHWAFDFGGTSFTSDAAITAGSWSYVVATVGAKGGTIFVNGRGGPLGPAGTPATVNGGLVVGCGTAKCFTGNIGEVRIYPEAWTVAPRVTDDEKELQLTDQSRADFGQPLRVLSRGDIATSADDVVTEYEYASPVSPSRAFGNTSSEASRLLQSDGSSGNFLSYTQRFYDGLPYGQVSAGSLTQTAQFNGAEETANRPTDLPVVSKTEYGDATCPGRATRSIDPNQFATETFWDGTCTFAVQVKNALGHSSYTKYYGLNYLVNQPTPTISGPYGSFTLSGRYGQVGESIDANGASTRTTYDEWGRPIAVWAPLDRRDRPGRTFEYADAVCEQTAIVAGGGLNNEALTAVPAPCQDPVSSVLRSPPRTTSLVWDDQQSTGAYRKTHSFGDGQEQSQVVKNGAPDWSVSGIADFDIRGRAIRSYRVRYLPRLAAAGVDPCPAPGEWCDSSRLKGDPLRINVAAVQTAYDAQSRVIRIYGPTVPMCQSDPSTLAAGTGAPACDSRIAKGPDWDVTMVSYPAPGDTLTTDAKGIPTLMHQDTRGLVTLFQEYLRPAPTSAPAEYSKVQSVYDPLGRLKSVTDQAGNTTTNDYDALSNLVATNDPDMGWTGYYYDLRSQLTDRIVATGEKTTNKYDALGRVVETDYLRPKVVPSGTQPAPTRPVLVRPPEFCAVAPGPPVPVQLIPSRIGPRPPAFTPLTLSRGTLNDGEAQLRLPFDLSLHAPAGIRYVAGTLLSISTNGRVQFGTAAESNTRNRANSNALPIANSLYVFATPLVLKDGGLRFAAAGENGSRTLTIEWDGVLASDHNKQVVVRAVLSEGNSPIRYEFERVPQGVTATIGLRLETGETQLFSLISASNETRTSLSIGSGSALELGESLPSPAVRLSCTRNPASVEIPIAGADVDNTQLHLRYRVFADCAESCQGDRLKIGYRDSVEPSIVRPLTLAAYTQRSLRTSGDANAQNAEAIDIILPNVLRAKNFTLVLERNVAGSAGGRPFMLDLGSIGMTSTVYEPEERVLRTYDSGEPPYFIETKTTPANSVTRVEAQPALAFTFDVPGLAAYQSASGANLTCNRMKAGRILQRNVIPPDVLGASGRGIKLENSGVSNTTCDARGFSTGSKSFTAELWIRPEKYPTSPQMIWSAGSGPSTFSITILPTTGQLSCTAGRQGTKPDMSLPTDAWSHVALTYEGSTLSCFVNGVRQGDAISAPVNATNLISMRLGDQTGSASINVDEVRILGASRSNDEILADALRPLAVGPPRGNLVHIDFSDPSPAGTAADQSKAHNDAVWHAGRIVPGIEGMSFDTGSGTQTTGGQVRVEDSKTLQLADLLTAELWMKTRNHKEGPARLMGKWQGTALPGWRLDLEPHTGRLRWEVVTDVTPPQHQVFVTYEIVNDDAWHHVAATYDGTRLRVFIDGLPAHRWCSPIESTVSAEACSDPPRADKCSVETVSIPNQEHPIGDAICLQGRIDNRQPLLIANDGAGAAFDGFVDEIRVSNYAKKEFEVAASSRLASAFTQLLGRETILRNQLPVSDDLADQVARELRAFDIRGKGVSWTKYVRGQKLPDSFLARTVADSLGRVSLLEYPHGEVAASGFDLGGTQNSLVGYGPLLGQTPSQSRVYLTNAAATVTGKPQAALFGNRVATLWSYNDDPTPAGGFGRDDLHTATVSGPAGALSDRTYQWDVVGNLESVNDNAPDAQGAPRFAATYGHDDLRRIGSAALTISGRPLSSTPYAYSYDALGNLRTKEDATQDFGRASLSPQCPFTSNAFPHALTLRSVAGQSGGDSYCYDQAGRLAISDRTFSYFARGKMRQVSNSAGSSLSLYDYDGNADRVRKTENGSSQTVAFGFYREMVTGPQAIYEATYSAGNRLIARRLWDLATPDPSQLWWYHVDHLGGTNFMTDIGGAEVAATRAYYKPFGEFAVEPVQPPPAQPPAQPAPQSDKPGHREFTGKELDATGLYDFGARSYDPATGQFIQADEVKSGSSAQSQNSYSYALNNPLVFVDPSGHAAECKECVFEKGETIEAKKRGDVAITAGPITVKPLAHIELESITVRPLADEGKVRLLPELDFSAETTNELLMLNKRDLPDALAEMQVAKENAKSAWLAVLPPLPLESMPVVKEIPLGTISATSFDINRGENSEAAKRVLKYGAEKTAHKLLHHTPFASSVPLIFQAWETKELHEAMMEYGAAAKRVDALKERRYELMRKQGDPNARYVLPHGLGSRQFYLGSDGGVYPVDRRPFVRY
jgi:RHS repeat-associated protein